MIAIVMFVLALCGQVYPPASPDNYTPWAMLVKVREYLEQMPPPEPPRPPQGPVMLPPLKEVQPCA